MKGKIRIRIQSSFPVDGNVSKNTVFIKHIIIIPKLQVNLGLP